MGGPSLKKSSVIGTSSTKLSGSKSVISPADICVILKEASAAGVLELEVPGLRIKFRGGEVASPEKISNQETSTPSQVGVNFEKDLGDQILREDVIAALEESQLALDDPKGFEEHMISLHLENSHLTGAEDVEEISK